MLLTPPNTITIDGFTAVIPLEIWNQCNDKLHPFHKEAKQIAQKIAYIKNGMDIKQ
jgi:hypothetical protein